MKKIFIAVAAIFMGSRLIAQTDSILLDPVVVTAHKYPSKTSLTGKVITIISSEQLEKSGTKDLAQVLAEQTGIYIAGANSNSGKDKSIYLRGARVDHTLITIDGIPVYDPGGIGSNFDIRNLSVQHIERIEILKGSQSTLYGSDAIAGVINIITKKNTGKLFSADAGASAGSFSTWKTRAGMEGNSGVLDYNLNYSYTGTSGINESISPANVSDKDGFEQNSIQVGLGLKAGSIFSIRPFTRYNKIKGDIDQGAYTDELDYTYKQESLQAGMISQLELGKMKLNVSYSYNFIDRIYTDDSVKSRNGFDTYSRGMYKGKEHFADVYFVMPFGHKGSILTAGTDFRSSRSDQEFFSTGFFGPFQTINTADSLRQHQFGFYAALNLQPADGFRLELGNRLNIHSTYGSNDVFNINPSFFWKNRMKLFFNFSSGYRTPSLYQLFSEYGNHSLKPEKALTLEGGVHYFSANKKMDTRFTTFSRNVQDVIFFYFDPVTFRSLYINQDKQRDHGAELELNWRPRGNLNLKGFYSYVNGKIRTVENGKDTSYFNLLRRPKYSAGMTLTLQLTERLYISASTTWFNKRDDAFFNAQSFQTERVKLDAYQLASVYTEYMFTKPVFNVFADFRNITNSRYQEIAGFASPGFHVYGGFRFRL